jgi:hypothetical protein
MSFIRAKTQKNAKKLRWPERQPTSGTYYYLVESYRENGRVRQRTLAYLGGYSSVEDALARLPQDIAWWKDKALPRAQQSLDEAKAYYDAALGRGPEPAFVPKQSKMAAPAWRQWRHHREKLALPGAEVNYYKEQRHVDRLQHHIAQLEARLIKLQQQART